MQQYLVDLNATQAAIRAGYSVHTASEIGFENLRKPQIAEAIQLARNEIAEKTGITVERVLKELARIGLSKMSDVSTWGVKEIALGFDAEGKKLLPEDIGNAVVVRYQEAAFVTPFNSADLSADILAVVSEVSITKDGSFKVKLHDKNAALTQIGRHLGMFTDKTEHSGSVSLKQALDALGDD